MIPRSCCITLKPRPACTSFPNCGREKFIRRTWAMTGIAAGTLLNRLNFLKNFCKSVAFPLSIFAVLSRNRGTIRSRSNGGESVRITRLTTGSSVDDGGLQSGFSLSCRLPAICWPRRRSMRCTIIRAQGTRLRGIAATTSCRAMLARSTIMGMIPTPPTRAMSRRATVRIPRRAIAKIRALRAVSWPRRRSCRPSCSLSSGLRPFASWRSLPRALVPITQIECSLCRGPPVRLSRVWPISAFAPASWRALAGRP